MFLVGAVGFERYLLGNRFLVHKQPFKMTGNGFVRRVNGVVQAVASRKAARQIGYNDAVAAVAIFMDDDWKSHQRSSHFQPACRKMLRRVLIGISFVDYSELVKLSTALPED